jgi:hypothetical protein
MAACRQSRPLVGLIDHPCRDADDRRRLQPDSELERARLRRVEAVLAVGRPDLGRLPARAATDQVVVVEVGPPGPRRQLAADGRLAGAHEAQEEHADRRGSGACATGGLCHSADRNR